MRRPASIEAVLGIFGGTFDPVHIGHLRTAYELRERLGLDSVRFVPAAVPPHRPQPAAPIELRVAMLETALANEIGFSVDRREIDRPGPSYTIDTAKSLRAEFPDHAICLMLGMDAFLGLPDWRDWADLPLFVNLVVARRPGASLPDSGPLGRLLDERRIEPGPGQTWKPAGQIIVQDVTQLEVSATELRASMRSGVAPRFLVPDAVWRLMEQAGCYAD